MRHPRQAEAPARGVRGKVAHQHGAGARQPRHLRRKHSEEPLTRDHQRLSELNLEFANAQKRKGRQMRKRGDLLVNALWNLV